MKPNRLFLIALTLMWSMQLSAQSFPVDFEGTPAIAFENFGGGSATVIDNPYIAGINTSAKVAQMVKTPGETYGGSFFALANPIDFTTNKLFKVKVYSPRANAKMLFKVENLTNGGVASEKELTIGVANEWVELTFDFSDINVANSYQKLVFIFDLGTAGDGSANFTWQFDDIRQVSPSGPVKAAPSLPISFQDTATINYRLTDFGGNSSSIVVDPTNASNLVAKVVKTNIAEVWAGTTAGGIGLAQTIPITASETKMSVRVWSPTANTIIRLKLEDKSDGTHSVETEKSTTVASAWEILVFDFANQATGTAVLNPAFTFNKVSIFFNFGTTGAAAGEQTYYFDDVTFGVLSSIDDLLRQGFTYYPNPVSDVLNLSAQANLGQVEVLNLMGQQVMSVEVGDTHTALDLSTLSAGVYVVRATIGTESGSFRIVKN